MLLESYYNVQGKQTLIESTIPVHLIRSGVSLPLLVVWAKLMSGPVQIAIVNTISLPKPLQVYQKPFKGL